MTLSAMATEVGVGGARTVSPTHCPPPRSSWGCTLFLFSRVCLGLFFSDSHRSGRFRNHSASSSSAFEMSPRRSPCSWPWGHLGLPQPHLQSPQVPWERIFRNSRLRRESFSLVLACVLLRISFPGQGHFRARATARGGGRRGPSMLRTARHGRTPAAGRSEYFAEGWGCRGTRGSFWSSSRALSGGPLRVLTQ